MSFQTIPVTIAGPSNQSRSRAQSSQSTINFYQELDEGGKSTAALMSWPGQSLYGSTISGIDRGQHVMAGVAYRVVGPTLYKVQPNGVHADKGTVLGGSRCTFATDGENLFIVNDGVVQYYSIITDALLTVTDADIVGSIAVDFINNQFVYTKPNLFVISDVGDGTEASGLNAAQAESQPDNLERAYVFDQIVYMLGTHTTEPWYNDGTGNPPFSRIEAGMMTIGLGALHSPAHNDNFMYMLGDDRQIYQIAGGNATRVSDHGVSHAMENYADVSDAVGWTLTLEGTNFYVITFPSADKTWMLNESLGRFGWTELSYGANGGRYNANSYSYFGGKHLLGDESNGKLYELGLETFDNDGSSMRRVRTLSSIHGGLLQHPGKRLQMSRFEIIMEKGVGLVSGQGEDPIIIIEASYDGGKSFSAETFMKVGRLGQSNIRAEWFGLQSFYDLIIRISTSDPVQYTLLSGAIDIRVAGR